MLKRLLCISTLFLSGLNAVLAYDFESEGIYYLLSADDETTCAITSGDSPYTEGFTIPRTVEHGGKTYRVTAIADLGANSIESLEIPGNIISIKARAFNSTKSLRELYITDGSQPLTLQFASYYDGDSDRTGLGQFYHCPLEKVTIHRELSYRTGDPYGYSPFGQHHTLKKAIVGGACSSIPPQLLYYCEALDELTLEAGVETMGYQACAFASALKTVSLPETLTDISSAFFYCTSLEEIAVPQSVTRMDRAFQGCSSLTSTNIPDGVEDISYTFSGCQSLQSIEIPSTVTNIDYTFSACQSLTDVVVPQSVTSMVSAFNSCFNLVNVNIPAGITSIEGTFTNCHSLREIEIPSGVTNLYRAFIACKSLEQIEIPDGVTIIDAAFSDCSSLRRLVIPASVKSLGFNTFSGCSSLEELTLPSGLPNLGRSCFKGCESLRTIEIPAAMKSIDAYAFQGFSGLRRLVIPPTVTTLEDESMMGCTGLSELIIEDCDSPLAVGFHNLPADGSTWQSREMMMQHVPIEKLYIGRELVDGKWSGGSLASTGMFSYCARLREVTVGEKASSNLNNYFNECTSLEKAEILNRPTSMISTFYNCHPLSEITIPETVTDITSAFYGSSLVNVVVPPSVSKMDYAFKKCEKLETSNIPDGVTALGGTFDGCHSLKSIEIPESCTSFSFAFARCRSLDGVKLPDGTTNINRAFVDCKSLTELNVPSTVSVYAAALYGCENLRRLEWNTTVPSTTQSVFDGCTALEEVVIGPDVKNVWTGLSVCPQLKKIVCEALEPPVGYTNSFTEAQYDDVKLYVPGGCFDAYKNCNPWKLFVHATDGIVTGIIPGTTDVDDFSISGNCVACPRHSYIYDEGGRLIWQGTGSFRLSPGRYIVVSGNTSRHVTITSE